MYFTTLGKEGPNRQGVIGVCPAANVANCQSSNNASLTGWQIVTPPHPGGVTLLSSQSPTVLMVDNGGYQLKFDLTTYKWGNG